MIKVYVGKQLNYPVSAVAVKKFLQDFFKTEGIYSDAFVSVALVDKAKMMQLARKYYPKDNNLHNVFSFVEGEVTGFKYPSSVGLNLGEIVVCYPLCVKQAEKENKLIQEKLLELVKHGGEHLLGRHHE